MFVAPYCRIYIISYVSSRGAVWLIIFLDKRRRQQGKRWTRWRKKGARWPQRRQREDMSPVFAVVFVVCSFFHHLSVSFYFATSSMFSSVRRSWPLTSLSVCHIGRICCPFVFDIVFSVIMVHCGNQSYSAWSANRGRLLLALFAFWRVH